MSRILIGRKRGRYLNGNRKNDSIGEGKCRYGKLSHVAKVGASPN
jgi:hypothetical protein